MLKQRGSYQQAGRQNPFQLDQFTTDPVALTDKESQEAHDRAKDEYLAVLLVHHIDLKCYGNLTKQSHKRVRSKPNNNHESI